ncbi:hypothetical protein V493_05960 [Pseudogymnoascus sp. VKM F-4281 (FW-2241)]|nr:hypothetical protein V493_05960 [Pseudogymnoascus sp. VKM F-4281 (FW-2241)]
MSFRQNGQHRYGHVPPQQYGGQQPAQNVGLGLQRQSSFDNGDDARFFDNSNGTQPPPAQPSAYAQQNHYGSQRSHGGGQDELFLEGSGRGHRSPERPHYSPQPSQYTNQYASGAPQTPSTPSAYNPQHFSRTQSQSQAHVQTPNYNPQLYSSQSVSSHHQPYVPAAYQPQQPPVPPRPPAQSPYMQGPSYGTSPMPQHSQTFNSPPLAQNQQANPYWSPQIPQSQQYSAAPPLPSRAPTQPAYEPSYEPSYDPSYGSSYTPSLPAPLPPKPVQYSAPPATAPHTTNGATYGSTNDYRAHSNPTPYPAVTQIPMGPSYSAAYDDFGSDAFGGRTSRPSSNSNPPQPVPPEHDGQNISQLRRHPTGRALPTAPVIEDTDPYDDGQDRLSAEVRAQEVMYKEIEAAVGANVVNRTQISQPHAPMSGDLLDTEFGDHPGSNGIGAEARTPTAAQNSDQMYIFEDSDEAEAVSGVLALRIADEAEANRSSMGSFGLYSQQKPPQETSQDASSDSDYAMGQDLGIMGGGLYVPMAYGNDVAARNEMQDESRPLPTPSDMRGREAQTPVTASVLGGLTDYSVPGGEAHHRFRTHDTGPENANLQGHRNSFDEGDEGSSLGSRVTGDSRLSGRSGSDSPSREEYPDIPYHPGISAYNRPLPAVPPLSENRTPQLLPAGSYRNPQTQQQDPQRISQMYPPDGPESYATQDLPNPGGQFVPRSASLTSHSSTPLIVPPMRSRTDAEERQARQRAQRGHGVAVDGFDAGTPQSTVPLDLPALPPGRRKKATPENLRSSDYKKCIEPWALSSIAEWIREMYCGESGDGEADLRVKSIQDLLVALFTHKVPTMNTADAEVISAVVVKDMLRASVLVEDEEWVKFGPGEVSGVLWQMCGSGCYSPKVHEHEIHGRCYSHHCHRTLKKINLHTQKMAPAKRVEPWHEFFKLTKAQIDAADNKEVLRQNNLHEIIMSEDKFMVQLDVLRTIYRDELQAWQPPIIGQAKLPRFIQQVFGRAEAVKNVNMNHLLAQLKYRQQDEGPWVTGFSSIFREWTRRASQVYLDYAASYPNATYLVRREMEKNVLFRQFLDQAQSNKVSDRLGWDTYLFAPLKRLQQYTLLLKEVNKHTYVDNEERANLLIAIEEVDRMTLACDEKVNEENKKIEMQELQTKLFMRPGFRRVDLHLDHLGRQLILQGDLQRPGTSRFNWLETRAILFDHYLVLAKAVVQRDSTGQKNKEVFDISKQPIPMQLLVLESTNDDAVVKSKGLIVTTTRPAPSTSDSRISRTSTASDRPLLDHSSTSNSMTSISKVSSNATADGDARSMFPFRVKHLGSQEVHTLYAPTAQNRQEWCEKIMWAKERHAASLFSQNAEPFRLKVLADTAFATDPTQAGGRSVGIPVVGTPLDRAIKDIEREYGHARQSPVCRAQVNCATAFSMYGKSMVAIGTDYGVYISEVNNPRGWTRSIQSSRITQIAVLEEFSVCLVLSDKALIAYHLDSVVPVSNFPAPQHDSARRAPQKISGSREVSFFATAKMKDRTLVFYKGRGNITTSSSSTFKVLEPVFQKSTEKRSKLFGRSKTGGGTTEFFREFDEFYIPVECYGINLFHSYIAVCSVKGFELLTLDKKITMSIPDPNQPNIATIAERLQGQKPLGMFRLSDAEFLLCYQDCGVYIDKHGEVSRSVVLEFVGKAKSAAMYGAYLILFDTDFVEVRNAENGRLRQIIAGKDVRCLDYGVQGASTMANRSLKVAMAHPEMANCQLVVELVLNEGQRE